MKTLVTGAAGFIGSHIVNALSAADHEVIGIDNLNSYYDVRLKYARLRNSGIEEKKIGANEFVQSEKYPSYRFQLLDITDRERLQSLFKNENFTHVIHLAAQAGVRYSLENPYAYIDSNIVGFINILEACRHYPVNHLVFASSSSVYGANAKIPYSESDRTDSPVSLYAATKKADELMAFTYSQLYGIPATGIRFFTVYGPWGRPDMSPSLFMSAILSGKPIKVFNHGNMERDFTYIDDIVEGTLKVIPSPPQQAIPHAIYNMGCSAPVKLTDFIETIEKVAGKPAIKELTEMQPGDVISTYADTSLLEKDFGYKPSTSIETGIHRFYEWFVRYYS
jgi:UDP-glucuronate 4-epimerase